MSLADELSALKAHGVTSAEFYEDGRLKRVEMGPSAGPLDLPGLDDDTRGIMVLPTEVTGGWQPRGGPATAPRQPSDKPKDLMRDLILADLAAPPALDENDLPEEPEIDEPEQPGEDTRGVEIRDDFGQGAQPAFSAEEAEGRGGQGG